MLDNSKELFIVVDKNDTILGYRTRFDCHHDKTLIHRAVDIMLMNDKGEILLQKRSQQKDSYPGYYTFSASGHCTKGETYEQTASRELQEELGIKTPLTFVQKFIMRDEAFETEMVAIFKGRYNSSFNPAKDEVEEVEFFSIEQIANRQEKLTPCARQSFQKLNIL